VKRDISLAAGIPAEQFDRFVAFKDRWGGLTLPPARVYEGGPRYFGADCLEEAPVGGWWFEAGMQRCSVPFSFMIGPDNEFGIFAYEWAPMHASIEGWIESLALARHAELVAEAVQSFRGAAVDDLDLSGMEKIEEVQGLADTWWRGADKLIAIYRGEAEAMRHPGSLLAFVYSGLDEWGLRGG
jgi:hypothetical protein